MKNYEFIVIDTLNCLMKSEIKNFFIYCDHEIVIWLEDNSKVKITTKNLTTKEFKKLKGV
ncbi:MAG: hypothetical protein IKM43_01275 [Clostridia bacterium]|nr:hypothetical protein [Clostridia bacterium]